MYKRLINQRFCNGNRQQGLKSINFVYSKTYLQQKKKPELKQKIHEHTKTKTIFKPIKNWNTFFLRSFFIGTVTENKLLTFKKKQLALVSGALTR
jgi:hypothetical protein